MDESCSFERGFRVHIVDDDAGFRRAVARVLSGAGLSVSEHPDTEHFLGADPGEEISCVLLDMFMPGGTAFDLLEKLPVAEHPPPVILVTACDDFEITVDTMKAGATDYLVKPLSTPELFRSVRRALALDARRQPARRAARLVRKHYARLNGVERNVLVALSNGRVNKQLSRELNVSERTVKTLRAGVMSKMEVSSLAGLVRSASLLGLVEHAAVRELRPY